MIERQGSWAPHLASVRKRFSKRLFDLRKAGLGALYGRTSVPFGSMHAELSFYPNGTQTCSTLSFTVLSGREVFCVR